MSMRFLKNCLLIFLFVALIHFYLKMKTPTFSKEALVEIGKKYAGKDIRQVFQNISSELEERYPGHIVPKKDREWVMFKFSGMTLSITILHATLTEYVLFAGSPLDTDGYLGRHWVNSTMQVISETGSLKYWKEGDLEATEYKPGEYVKYPPGSAGCLSLKANTWFFEHGYGFVPLSVMVAISDSVFTAIDVTGLLKMLRAFAVAYVYELKSEIGSFVPSY